MKIDKKLNIVVPFECDDKVIYFHSIPVAREVFEKYHRPMAQAHARMMSDEVAFTSGPLIAPLELKDASIAIDMWEGREGVQNGLMNEIKRLTSVFSMTDVGWGNLPLSAALSQHIIDEDIWREVEGKIVFFTLMSYLTSRKKQDLIQSGMTAYWDVLFTSLMPTEYIASLPILTEIETSVTLNQNHVDSSVVY